MEKMSIEDLEVTLKMLNILYCYTKRFLIIKNVDMDLSKSIKYLLLDNKYKWITSHDIDSHLDYLYVWRDK